MQRIDLEVKPRDLGEKDKKRNLNELRNEGWIPGTLYGNGKPVDISVDNRDFNKALHNQAGINALFNIKLGSETAVSVVKEIQRHVWKRNPIHVDFKRINMKETLTVNVPTHVVGEAPGVKNSGGILEHITREVRVRCLPDDIPASIDVDVTKLELGHGVKVKNLPALKGIEYLTIAETIVVNVVAPKVEEVKAPTPAEVAAAAAQPEVIAKGKKDEEGAAAAPAGGGAAAAKPAAGGASAAPATAKGKEEKKK